jgi:membrane protease YdiL (CAAX protease family)
MNATIQSRRRTDWHPGASLLLFIGTVGIAVVGYWPVIPTGTHPLVRLLLALLWLLLAWLAGASDHLRTYRSVLLAFFGVSFGIWLATMIGDWPSRLMSLDPDSLQGLAVAKVGDVVPIVAAILVVNKLDGGGLDRLYLRNGKIGLSLVLGLAIGALCGLMFLAMGGAQAIAYAGPVRLLAALPLMLVFAVSNGFMEELWFRGSFLNRFETVLGPAVALLVTTLAFAAMHGVGTYATGAPLLQFLASTFVLGLSCGWVVQHTRSLWGAVLGHAIGDIFVVLGFFVTLL